MAVSQIVLKCRRATKLFMGTSVDKLGAQEIFTMNFFPFFGKASQKKFHWRVLEMALQTAFPWRRASDFLSTLKQGDNALVSVHPSVRPSVRYHQSKLIVHVSVIIFVYVDNCTLFSLPPPDH